MSSVFDAHMRLLASLPVRTHHMEPPKEVREPMPRKVPVIIGGQQYESVRAAAQARKIARRAVYEMLTDGRARYV